MKEYQPIKQSSMLISLGIMNGQDRQEYPAFLQFILALHPMAIVIPMVSFGFFLGLLFRIIN